MNKDTLFIFIKEIMIGVFIFLIIMSFIVIIFYYNREDHNKPYFYIPEDLIKINKENIKEHITKVKTRYKPKFNNLSFNKKRGHNPFFYSREQTMSPSPYGVGTSFPSENKDHKKGEDIPVFYKPNIYNKSPNKFSFEIYSNINDPLLYKTKMIINSIIENDMPYVKKRYNKMTKNIINDLNFILGSTTPFGIGGYFNLNMKNDDNEDQSPIIEDQSPIIEELNDEEEFNMKNLYNKSNQTLIIEEID